MMNSFQDDISERPHVASAINSLANYSAAIPVGPADPDAKPAVEKANLGTLMGVYLPCIQNIFGVILFIRMTWIVGTAGAIEGFFVVFVACCVVSERAISHRKKKAGRFGAVTKRTSTACCIIDTSSSPAMKINTRIGMYLLARCST